MAFRETSSMYSKNKQKYIKAYTQTIESSPPKTRYMLIRSS